MSDKTTPQKLLIKPGKKILIINPPQDYDEVINPLPEGVTRLSELSSSADFIQVFVKDRKELESWLPQVKDLINPSGIFWVTYYKGTSKHKTDINRDIINAYGSTIGLQGIAMISIDEDWSALRMKKLE